MTEQEANVARQACEAGASAYALAKSWYVKHEPSVASDDALPDESAEANMVYDECRLAGAHYIYCFRNAYSILLKQAGVEP